MPECHSATLPLAVALSSPCALILARASSLLTNGALASEGPQCGVTCPLDKLLLGRTQLDALGALVVVKFLFLLCFVLLEIYHLLSLVITSTLL